MRQTGTGEEGSEREGGGGKRERARARDREGKREREGGGYEIKKGRGEKQNKVGRMSNTLLHKALTLSQMHIKIHHTYIIPRHIQRQSIHADMMTNRQQ